MYISAESYEEMYLKDKEDVIVRAEVEKLRSETRKLKMKIESPAYVYDPRAFPSDSEVIEIYRGYMEKAITVLSSLNGGADVLSEEEKSALIFDSMIDDIRSITLTAGRYLQDKYEIVFSNTEAELSEIHLEKESVSVKINKDETLRAIKALHIGEWRESYTPEQYGCTLNEPTKWQLRIEYKSGAAPRFYDGIGVFPYNFKALCRLFGADIV